MLMISKLINNNNTHSCIIKGSPAITILEITYIFHTIADKHNNI